MADLIPLNSLVGIATINVSGSAITCMSVDPSNGDIYFCGSFTTVNSVAQTQVGCVTRNGMRKAWAPTFGAGSSINSILVTAAGIAVGGNFTTANGSSRVGLAMFDASGALLSWSANTNGQVYALATDGVNVYVGGDFTQIASTAVHGFGAITIAGSVVTTLSQAITAAVIVYAIACDSAGNVYCGGIITTVQTASGAGHGVTVSNACQLSTSTGWATAWNANANNTVYAICVDSSNNVYLAGYFTTIRGTTQKYLAQVSGATPTLGSWNPTVSAPSFAPFLNQFSLLAAGTDIYWSIGFSGAGETGCQNGTTAYAWDPIVNSYLLCLAYDANNPVAPSIWVGGSFYLVLGALGGLLTDVRVNLAKVSTRATIPTRLMY